MRGRTCLEIVPHFQASWAVSARKRRGGSLLLLFELKKKHGLEDEIQGIPSLCKETLINPGRGGLPAENLDR